MKMNFSSKKWLWYKLGMFFSVVGVSMVIYMLTRATLIQNYADSTDLILAGLHKGRAHPPGYSLLTLVLHYWLKLFDSNVYASSSAFVGLTQAVANGLLALVIVVIMDIVKGKRKLWLMSGFVAAVLWGVSLDIWSLSVVAEVFALSQALNLIFILTLFDYIKTPSNCKLVLMGLFAGLAVGYHPLNWLIIVAGLIYFYLSLNKQLRAKSWLILNFTFCVTFLASVFLLPSISTSTTYSWVQSTPISLLRNYLRLDYSSGGSAVETYTDELNMHHSFSSLLFWLKQLSASNLPGLIFMLIGLKVLWKWSKSIFWWLTFLLVLSGPMLVMYMKFPLKPDANDVEFYWGIFLRQRMLYVFQMVMGLTAGIGISYVFKWLMENSKWGKWLTVLLSSILIFISISMNYQKVDLSESNFSDLYFSRILNSMPRNAVLFVDNDMVFGFLGKQIIDQLRQDVIVYPVNISPRPGFKTNFFLEHNKTWLDSDNYYHVPHLISQLLNDEKKIFWYGSDEAIENYLGFEGNPFYGVPYGYVTEIENSQPDGIDSFDYGLSVSLAEADISEGEWWTNGIKAHLAAIHTKAGYHAARAGLTSIANSHEEIAFMLTSSEKSESEILSLIDLGRIAFEEQQSYLNYKPMSSLDFEHRGNLASKVDEKHYFLTRSLLLSQNNPKVIKALLDMNVANNDDFNKYLEWLLTN